MKKLESVFLLLLLCAPLSMARVHTAIGGNFSVGSTWQDGIVPSCSGGETVVVAANATLIGDVSCILGSKTSAVGPAVHLLSGSTFAPRQNVTMTLRGYDNSANVVALIDINAQFIPQAGATILSDCALDGDCTILNNGVVQSQNVTWTIPSSNVNWNNTTSFTTVHISLLDQFNLPNVWVAQLGGPWISNSQGTALGSSTDSSVTFSNNPSGTLLHEVSSLAQVTTAGTYYINYDAGVLYYYQTQTQGYSVKATYKYLTFVGANIVSRNNAAGNQAIFDHSSFAYMGSNAGSNNYVINVAYKQSASLGANRLVKVTNNTFRYCKRLIGFTGPVTGTASDPILINGNTIYAVLGDAWGGALTSSLTASSYVSLQNNIVPDGIFAAPFLLAKVNGAILTMPGWTIQGNIVQVASFESDPPLAVVWPGSVMVGNFIMGFSGGFDGREIAGFGGTSGHSTLISRNVFVHPHRVLNLASYQQFSDNYIADYDHHGVNGPSNSADSLVTTVQLLRNIFTNGNGNSSFELGYVTHVWMDNVSIAQNTSIQKNNGSLEFGDEADGNSASFFTNLNIYNNLFAMSANGVSRLADTLTSNSRVHLYRADWSDFYNDTTTYIGLKTFSTFTWNGGEYDNSSVRNVKGVSLGDTNYTSPQSGLSVTWTYTSPTNVTLALNHGTPVQLESYDGHVNSATNITTAGIAGLYSGSLTDNSQNFPTALNNPATPIGMWVEITGGTGTGQIRRVSAATAHVLTVVPAWSTVPDTSSTYVLYKSEVKLIDANGVNYVITGVDLRSTPISSATDTGVGLQFNTINANPEFLNPNGSWRSWDIQQGGSGTEASIFQRLAANPPLVLTLGTYQKVQLAPANMQLLHGYGNQPIGASGLGNLNP